MVGDKDAPLWLDLLHLSANPIVQFFQLRDISSRVLSVGLLSSEVDLGKTNADILHIVSD